MCLLSVLSANAQPYLFDNKELPKLKKATLYVIMDTKTGKDDKYYDVFKEVWNYCAYEIIEPSEVGNYLSPDAFFINIHVTISQNQLEYSPLYKYLQVYELKIWKITPAYARKMDRKNFRMQDINLVENSITVAKIRLKPDDSKRFFVSDMLKKSDFLGAPYMLYTGPGIFKNYLQYLQTLLNKQLFYKERESICNYNELDKLKKSTLYIPKTLLNEYKKDKALTDQNKIAKIYDPKEIFEDYPGKYEFISIADLNNRIMEADETMYYASIYLSLETLVYSTITITNSTTGEIIFSESIVSGRSFPPKLIKILSESMNKK